MVSLVTNVLCVLLDKSSFILEMLKGQKNMNDDGRVGLEFNQLKGKLHLLFIIFVTFFGLNAFH